MTGSTRRGVVVADLLVAVVVIGIVAGVALPAVRKAREDAARAGCADHLRAIGVGVQGFATANDGVLPHNRTSTPHGSWNTQILPFIEQEQLARMVSHERDWWDTKSTKNRAVAATRVTTFICPAAPHPDRMVLTSDPDDEGKSFRAAPTDYVGSAGAYLHDNVPEMLHPGAMHHRTIVRRLRITDMEDGAGQTLFVVEMADKPNVWRAGKLAEDRSDKPQREALAGQWAAPNWNHLRSYTPDGIESFGPCSVNCSNQGSIYGFHQGGANVLFVDGSVRFLRARMSQEMLIALVTYAGGEVLGPDDY